MSAPGSGPAHRRDPGRVPDPPGAVL